MILGWRESDILYLRLAHPQEAAIGDLFTIYKKVHKVFHPRTKAYMGYLVNMTGVVRVIENDPPLTMVQIVQAYWACPSVMPWLLVSEDFTCEML